MHSKVDLHVHSKHSDRPSEWILRRIGSPESFVEPQEVYRRARAAGMDFVTISDHNCITGALEIAHLDGTFLSNEVTTYFPEDGCKIHCLVVGITEEQFDFIERLRPDIYELRDYFVEEDVLHSVAHPFFTVNGRLTPTHVEKLLLLFNRFEGLNGSRDRRASDLVNAVFRNLTPEWIDRARELHRIDPIGEAPWVKSFTGGSDDHSGLYVGSAYTETPHAETVQEYLEHLRAGRHELGGRAGSSLRLAHSFYEIAYSYYRDRFGEAAGTDLVGEIFKGLIKPATPRKWSFGASLPGVSKFRGYMARRRLGSAEIEILERLQDLLRQAEAAPARSPKSDDRATFDRASQLAHLLGHAFVERFIDHGRNGQLLDALQTFASLAPVGLGVAPYLASFATQHKDESFLQQISGHFEWSRGALDHGGPCWLTDTYGDVNGVAKMIQVLGRFARSEGRDLEVVTCEQAVCEETWRKNFEPVGTFALPEYEQQKVSFPPFLQVLEHIENRRPKRLILSTPGPLGLNGLMASKLLGIPAHGIYHTDFPAYVQRMTENQGLAAMTRSFLFWFYSQMERIYVPSEAYRKDLIAMGFEPERLVLLGRGVDTSRFDPAKRSGSFWRRYSDVEGRIRLLYVGRLAEEKNLTYLFDEFLALPSDFDAQLFVVGDGPQRPALERRAQEDARIRLTGILEGEALATAYASADLFIFPSVTDTFGNVVLEAMASGLPTIVSNKGGPAELVVPGCTGLVLDPTEGALANAVRRLSMSPALRRSMGQRARSHACRYDWSAVLEDLVGQDARRTVPVVRSLEEARARRDRGIASSELTT